MQQIEISSKDSVFVLTGAGVSAESGLPTFRAEDGLWAGHRVEDVCTPEAWERNPALVWDFYSKRREAAQIAQPNGGHIALAKLESDLGNRFFLCTQNVDDLHERSGSVRVHHMHGELNKSRCSENCGAPPSEDVRVYRTLDEVGRCGCGALLRPHIVWFGEIPLEMERITAELDRATVLLVVGTSGNVYPAASFVRWAGTKTRKYYIGPEPPLNATAFDKVLLGRSGEALPGLFSVKD